VEARKGLSRAPRWWRSARCCRWLATIYPRSSCRSDRRDAVRLHAPAFYTTLFRDRLLENLPLAREDVLAHFDDGVLVADAAGIVVAQNPAALQILGAEEDALRGRPLAEALARLAAPGARAEPRTDPS
jgi:PAS domain-containing protein